MSEKSSVMARRAWNILRLALMWTRKGGIFRNRAVISLNAFAKTIRKQLILHSTEERGALVYGDREFSFDDTPMVHVKMHRPSSLRFKMPCIVKPEVDFDYDHDDDDIMICVDDDDDDDDDDEAIDVKAEVFIAKFYEQMKMQRQISCSESDDVVVFR